MHANTAVNTSIDTLSVTFAALSDPTRRAMLARLSQGEASVNELAAPFKMSLPAVSKHIKVLERAGLLSRKIRGRIHQCRLQAERLAEAQEWMRRYEHFWNEKLDALESLLREDDKSKAKKTKE